MMNFSRWKVLVVVAVCAIGVLLALPNFLSKSTLEALPAWLPHKTLTLGLDLQGGSYLLMEADVSSVVAERLDAVVDGVRSSFREQDIGYTELGVVGEEVHVKLNNPDDVERARPILQELAIGMLLDVTDDGSVVMSYTDVELQRLSRDVVQRSIEIVRRRVDELGTTEPSIQRQGDRRIIIQVPGFNDPERLKEIIGQTAKMTFRFVDETASVEQARLGNIPATAELLASQEVDAEGNPLRWYVVNKRVIVSGDNLTDAQATFQQNQPVVSFKFDSVGAKRFGDATAQNIGRIFAIVLDDKVISAPVIRGAILGGSGIIEGGNMTVESANDLSLLLRAGALPAPLTILEERTVGAALGADSIAAGKVACVMALVLICGALLVCYGLFGIFANVALVFNFILMVGAMSALGSTLTLPGIAGMVLSLGMAVDANVLIHERIREEIRSGRGVISALDAGYRAATGTITDSNLTVIISAVFLYLFGSGAVKGFAVTLIIGTIVSMFTAVMVARMLTVAWLRWFKPRQIPI
jgi:preprotein translocase subunit SecD